MKLRQKLAMVLATAMVVASVPVTTMAASTNSFNRTISVAEGTYITTDSAVIPGQELDLIVDYTDLVTEDEFYLVATDFEFDEDAYVDVKVYGDSAHTVEVGTVEATSETELVVKVTEQTDRLYIPMAGEVQDGEPAITVDAVGSYASTSTISFGEVITDETVTAAVEDETNIITYDTEAELGSFIVEEKVAGELAGKLVTIELAGNYDLEFVGTDVTLKGQRGLTPETTVEATVSEDDDFQVLTFEFPAYESGRPGSVIVSGLTVESTAGRDDLKKGEVAVDVRIGTEDDTDEVMEEVELVLSQIVDEYLEVTVENTNDEDEEIEVIKAGLTKSEVTVVLEQEGDLIKRDLYLEVEGAKFLVEKDEEDKEEGESDYELVDEIEISAEDFADDEVEVEVVLVAEADTAAGDVTITVTGRDLEDEIEVEVTEVVQAFGLELEQVVITPGVKDEIGGKIIITEEEAGDLEGSFIIKKADDEDEFELTDVEVEVDGDIEVEIEIAEAGDNEALEALYGIEESDYILVTIDRESDDEASTITIKNFEISSRGYIAEGGYDLAITGEALTPEYTYDDQDTALVLKDFVVTDGAAENVVTPGRTVEISTTGDDAFITPEGRTVAGLRTVAEAFGVEPHFAFVDGIGGVITLYKGDTVVQFVNGSEIMTVNGGAIIMDTTARIVDGRTYVPVRFLAEALGIEVDFVDGKVIFTTN